MRHEFSPKFSKAYEQVGREMQQQFDKQLQFLLTNLRHPSLHAKKYDEAFGLWQARVNRNWRFYFTIEADVYYIRDLARHPK